MSSIKGKSAFLTLLCISCMFSTPSQAGLLGSSIHLTYCYPDNCTVFQDYGTQLAGNGIEFPGVISGGQTLNLTDTQFIFTFITNVYGPALFHGVRSSDDTNSLA